ncbi:hypothetical protein V6Z12_D05G238100 [Gossypium hirsutum]
MGIIHHDQQQEEEALILSSYDQTQHFHCHQQPKDSNLISKVCVESKKLWLIAGPSIFSRLAMFSMTTITQSFAGHLGDLNLAAISIATTVIISITFGFLLGMASALETLCGQAYGAKQYQMLGLYLQRSWIVLFICSILLLPLFIFAAPLLKFMGQPTEVADQTEPTEDCSDCLGLWGCTCSSRINKLDFCLQAFSELWDFVKLSLASGVMILMENIYYRTLIIVSGYLHNTETAVDALSICMSIFGWESMIPLGFLAATGVRVANELGAGNAKDAKFATIVSVITSLAVGILFWLIIMAFHETLAMIFTSSSSVITMVNKYSTLLAFTIPVNCIQPVLSGVAVGSGWQSVMAFVNIGSYYLVGVPLGVLFGWLQFGITGIWAGMLCGTVVQTLILAVITMKCKWEIEARKARSYISNETASYQ